MEIDVNITQRINWLGSRMRLHDHEKDYIALQMQELAIEVAHSVKEALEKEALEKEQPTIESNLDLNDISKLVFCPECKERLLKEEIKDRHCFFCEKDL